MMPPSRPAFGSRRQIMLRMATELAVNIALPYGIYRIWSPALGEVRGLLLSSLPPLLWSIVEFVRAKRVDAVSLLSLGGIALSLIAFVGVGSARLLQLRENLVGGLIALVFLGSVAIGKPVIYALVLASSDRFNPTEAARLRGRRDAPEFRRTMRLMTLVWGLGMLAQTVAACVLVYRLSVSTYLAVSPVLGYATYGILGGWTWWYAKRARQRAESH